MMVDGNLCVYGTYRNQTQANEIAMNLREFYDDMFVIDMTDIMVQLIKMTNQNVLKIVDNGFELTSPTIQHIKTLQAAIAHKLTTHDFAMWRGLI
jgi:hypothetical protein